MQALIEQVVEPLVGELRVEAAHLSPRLALGTRARHRLGAVVAGGLLADVGEGSIDLPDREPDRTRQDCGEDEQLDHRGRLDAPALDAMVRLVGGERAQQCSPRLRVVRRCGQGMAIAALDVRADEEPIVHVDGARRPLRPLQELACLEEVPPLLARHRRVGDPLEQLAEIGDRAAKARGALGAGRRPPPPTGPLNIEMEAVERLPHLGRHLVAHRVRVVASPRDALHDRVPVLGREDQVTRHALLVALRAPGRESRVLADDVEECRPVTLPARFRLRGRAHHDGVSERRLGEPGGLLGALDVASDPVQRLRHSTQHGPDPLTGGPTCPCCRRPGSS